MSAIPNSSLPLMGRVAAKGGRVGAAACAISPAAPHPTLAASPPVPPHEGEGG
jgi:hypothetical protein